MARLVIVLMVFYASAVTAAPKRMPITPKELLATYKANEIAADLRLKGRPLVVIGVVEEVGKDAFGGLYVTLRTGNEFRPIRAVLMDDQQERAALLVRGGLVAIEGDGGGMVMGDPVLSSAVIRYSATAGGLKETWVPRLLARSEELCFATLAGIDRRWELIKKGGKPEENLSDVERKAMEAKATKHVDTILGRKDIQHVMAAAQKDLDRMKKKAMPCGHPLIWTTFTCLVGDHPGPECRFPPLRKSVAIVRADAPGKAPRP